MKEEQDDESSDRDTMGGPITDQPAGASEGALSEQGAHKARCSVAAGSALDFAWQSINPILRGAMDYADFRAGWYACADHMRVNENIQIMGCPRCDHEFEAEVTFESLEPNTPVTHGRAQP